VGKNYKNNRIKMNKIDIICILDMSGSMSSIIEKAREGFNKFLKDQKKSNNKINFSLMFFDTNFYMPYKNVDIKNVKKVNENTYYANGGTALYDYSKKTQKSLASVMNLTFLTLIF